MASSLRYLDLDELHGILTRVRDERWTELILLGPDHYLSDDSDSWPEHYKLATRVFKLRQPVEDLPDRIASLENLTTLDLSWNTIGAEGAKAIAASLSNLRSLDLSANRIRAEGAEAIAASLSNLTSLDLSANLIGGEGAEAIAASLNNLRSLDLSANHIGAEGAEAIAASLDNLTSLYLSNNGIGTKGAMAIAASLTNLTSLDLSNNGIGTEGIMAIAASLNNLTSLDLSWNGIGDDGAKALAASLIGLRSLRLYDSGIGEEGAKAILEAWSNRHETGRLHMLDLRENSDLSTFVPDEILDSHRDPQAILAAYRRITQDKTQTFNEAKLLVVGNEAVGKTSLLRYLIHGQPRDPSEERTPGIATQEKIEVETWSPEAGGIRLNVWDFGGQEMMRGTHRFFLTARSLYLLVLEDRREDDRSIHDWLKTIKNRAGDAPILVVINKSDQGKEALRLDEKGLRDESPEILAFLRTSCNDDDFSRETIGALREKIVDVVVRDPRMKHVRDPLPVSWLRIKDAVTQLAGEKSVLPLAEFQRLCETADAPAARVTDEDERRSLLRLLNDLGTIVAHGLESDARAVEREITLLDPNWLTEAIYKILTSADCAELQGEFSREHLTAWLDPVAYPPDRHEFILNMMQKDEVGLCFPLPGSDGERYLVPEALPASAPYYGNWPADCLRFRYRYDFLPRGLVPRFIVHAHGLLADPPTRWRTGAVFEAQDCPVLVEADVDRKEIDILVDGPPKRRRAALGIILHHLEAIHVRNPESEPAARVPLPDRPAADVGYDYLLKLEAKYGPAHEFDPEDSERAYTVAELLDGVRHEVRAMPPDGRAGASYHFHGDAPTIIQGGVETGKGDVRIGRQTEDAPAVASKTFFKTWQFFCLAGATAAVALFHLLYWLESAQSRFLIAGSAAIFVLAYLVVAFFNPERFFRRLIAQVVFGGLLVNLGGFAFEAGFAGEPAAGWLRWDGAVGIGFNAAWAVVVCALAFLEWSRTRSER